MRLSKLEAANHLGISPTTVNRRIKSGALQVEKEPHGSSYKIWVVLDDEPGGKPNGIPTETAAGYPTGIPTGTDEQPGGSPDEDAAIQAIIAPALEMARLQEQKRNAEDRAQSAEKRAETLGELAEYHKKLLTDSEWRYQEILQELKQSQQNIAALTRALPAPTLEPETLGQDPTTVIVTNDEPTPRRRLWWPFGRG